MFVKWWQKYSCFSMIFILFLLATFLPYLFQNYFLDCVMSSVTSPSPCIKCHFSGVGLLLNMCKLAANCCSTWLYPAFTSQRTPDQIPLLSIHLVSVINRWLSFLCQTRLTLLNLLVSFWEGAREKEEDVQTEKWSNCINFIFLREHTKDRLVRRFSQRIAAHLHWYPCQSVHDCQTLHNACTVPFQISITITDFFQKYNFPVVWHFFSLSKTCRDFCQHFRVVKR